MIGVACPLTLCPDDRCARLVHTGPVDVWIWPAYVGVLLGVTLFAVIFVPTLIVQTRRYGAPSLRRLIGTAAVAVYGVALVAYTLLPLPSGDLAQWCVAHGVSGAQLTPGQFLADIQRDTAGLGLRATLMSRTVLQVVLNVALFVPLGALLRRYAGRGILTSTLAAFAVSLVIELTQYTGVWGLIGCSYRVADVDDLIANTFGGFVGAVLAPVFLGWMPLGRQLSRTRLVARPVTVWRRWLGMVIDAFLFTFTVGVLAALWEAALLVAGVGAGETPWPVAVWLVRGVLAWVLVFGLPVAGSGASLGQRAVWLVPARYDGARPSFGARALRAWSVGGLWAALQELQVLPGAAASAQDLFVGLANLVAFVAVLGVIFTRGHRGLSGKIAGTYLVDARADSAEAVHNL